MERELQKKRKEKNWCKTDFYYTYAQHLNLIYKMTSSVTPFSIVLIKNLLKSTWKGVLFLNREQSYVLTSTYEYLWEYDWWIDCLYTFTAFLYKLLYFKSSLCCCVLQIISLN